jgi:hypothetical protein
MSSVPHQISRDKRLTPPVTLTSKCYAYVCIGCGALDQSERSDKLTCSTACRVRAHRNGELRHLRELASSLKILPASILQARAIEQLCPDTVQQIRNGRLTLEEAQPAANHAFLQLLLQAAEGP